MTKFLFMTLLSISCGYALWKGRADERLAAAACMVATAVSIAAVSPHASRYQKLEGGELIIDLAMLAIFILLALRSMRFWPLWIAGLQLTLTTSHVLKALDETLIPQVYAVAERFWSYPILIIIFVATWRGAHRPDDWPEPI